MSATTLLARRAGSAAAALGVLWWLAGCTPAGPPAASNTTTASATASSSATAVALASDGQVKAEWDADELRRIVPAERVQVWDPQEQGEVAFDAVPLVPVLDRALGPAWRQAPDLLFVARDGYTATVEVERVLAKPAWLALARSSAKGDRQPLRLTPRGRTPLNAGPAYLIWDSLHDAAIRSEGDHGWPYQVVRIETADLRQRYPQLAVAALPADPTLAQAVARGQQIVARYCLPCHAIGGAGGKVGPELVTPVGVVHTWHPRWLARWIDDPLAVRSDAKMPRPPLPAGDRQRHVADIVAYLTARTPPPPAP